MPPFLLFLLLLTLPISTHSSSSSSSSSSLHRHHHHHHQRRHHPIHQTSLALADACGMTHHRPLCIRSLSPFSPSSTARRPTLWWSQAAVSATLADTNRLLRYLSNLNNMHHRDVMITSPRRHAKAALSDCVDCLGDAAAELRKSLGGLRRLRDVGGGGGFGLAMNDVETWLSAAMTNQDTCREGIGGWRGPRVGLVRSWVLNATYLTSNALALVANLAGEE